MLSKVEYLLSKVAEECDEVGQRAIKAQIFSLDEVEPGQPFTNAARIEREFLDLFAQMEMLAAEGAIGAPRALIECQWGHEAIEAKKAKVERYMEHSRSLGTLEP